MLSHAINFDSSIKGAVHNYVDSWGWGRGALSSTVLKAGEVSRMPNFVFT